MDRKQWKTLCGIAVVAFCVLVAFSFEDVNAAAGPNTRMRPDATQALTLDEQIAWFVDTSELPDAVLKRLGDMEISCANGSDVLIAGWVQALAARWPDLRPDYINHMAVERVREIQSWVARGH